MTTSGYEVWLIGRVASPLVDRGAAPRQGDEGSPDAWLVFDPRVAEGIRDLRWAPRSSCSPGSIAHAGTFSRFIRDEIRENRLTGVFSTRSPDRPNPIGLHRVRIDSIEGTWLRVSNLEALDGTPIVDVKPLLGPVDER
ncbi:MAG: TrmO family methyltransferase domain-containing protein [Vicinamibacterales bacterium]